MQELRALGRASEGCFFQDLVVLVQHSLLRPGKMEERGTTRGPLLLERRLFHKAALAFSNPHVSD